MRSPLRGRDGHESSPLDWGAMEGTAHGENDPAEILRRSVENGRVHSSYLFTGTGTIPSTTAQDFARALVCNAPVDGAACEGCSACDRSREDEETEPIVLDGKGKRGPTHRHLGDCNCQGVWCIAHNLSKFFCSG